eukprot:11453478-Alexandrium_andersonii.AAC.2
MPTCSFCFFAPMGSSTVNVGGFKYAPPPIVMGTSTVPAALLDGVDVGGGTTRGLGTPRGIGTTRGGGAGDGSVGGAIGVG